MALAQARGWLSYARAGAQQVGHHNRSQSPDNGDDDQQLDKGKTSVHSALLTPRNYSRRFALAGS